MSSTPVGAAIKEMHMEKMPHVIKSDFPEELSVVSRLTKPIIAAVNGFAVCSCLQRLSNSLYQLGGGCELSMMCDIIYAGHKAEFSQPEITIGTIPGIMKTSDLYN